MNKIHNKVLLPILLIIWINLSAGGLERQRYDVKNVDEIIGTWEVVELNPPGENALSKRKVKYSFENDGTLITTTERIEGDWKQEIRVETFQYNESEITIYEKDGHVGRHKIWFENNRLVLQVPFGSIVLEKID